MHACIDREDAVLAMMILVSAGGMLAVLYCEKEPQSHSDVTPMLICWLLACMHCEHPSFTQEVYSIICTHAHTPTHTHTHIHTYTHTHTHIHTRIHTYILSTLSTRMHTHMASPRINTHMRTPMHTSMHTHPHICMLDIQSVCHFQHTYMHKYLHYTYITTYRSSSASRRTWS